VDKSVIIKISLTNAFAIEVQRPASEVKSFVEQISMGGYLDPVTGQFHPPQLILRVEAAPPERFGEGWFSEN
jgi:hypothetical protein